MFSERLQKASKDAGFEKQKTLADRVGVTQAAVSKWQSGTIPDGARLQKLAKALGVTADWLLGSEGDNPSGVMDDRCPQNPDLEIWRRRAKEAEQKLAEMKNSLREILKK
jgi:transcriptional regulator with XRE-family HTH domain